MQMYIVVCDRCKAFRVVDSNEKGYASLVFRNEGMVSAEELLCPSCRIEFINFMNGRYVPTLKYCISIEEVMRNVNKEMNEKSENQNKD